MPRYLRLRYILLYSLIYLAYSNIESRWVLEGRVTRAIGAALTNAGFPDHAFTVDTLTLSHLTLSRLKLDTDGVNTVDRVDVTYSPWSLLWGRVYDISVEKPDFVFSADALPPLKFAGGSTGSGQGAAPFLLSTLPFRNLSIRGLTLAWAGDEISPSVTGVVTVREDSSGVRQLDFAFNGAQKDLSVNIKGRVTESDDQTLNVMLDVPEARFDIPGVLMMSRAHGKFDMVIPPDAPVSANGEWVAGAMRIGSFPLDNISLIVQGRKPDFSLIGNADVTGVAQSNISLRLAEGADGAQLIAQISGTSPQQFLKRAIPSSTITLPDQQKFVVTLDMKDDDLAGLFTAPYSGGLFLYDDAATPFVSVAVGCETGLTDCAFTLPQTKVTVEQINRFAEPLMADFGLILGSGNIEARGNVVPFDPAGPMFGLQVVSKNLDMNWQGVDFTNAVVDVTRGEDGAYKIGDGAARVMSGVVAFQGFDLSATGAGRTTMRMKDIDLSALSDFVKVEGLGVTGRASGVVPVTFADFKPSFDRGGKMDGVHGTIKYAPENYPAFLGGGDGRMKVLRDTLQDYTFDTMTLNFSGDPFGSVSAVLSAKGRNEALFKDRPVHLNLNIDGPLAPAIQQLIPYVGGGETTNKDIP